MILLVIKDLAELEVVMQSAWKQNCPNNERWSIQIDDHIEAICIELEKDQNGCHKNSVIGVLYHSSHQDLKHFTENINDLVHSLKGE